MNIPYSWRKLLEGAGELETLLFIIWNKFYLKKKCQKEQKDYMTCISANLNQTYQGFNFCSHFNLYFSITFWKSKPTAIRLKIIFQHTPSTMIDFPCMELPGTVWLHFKGTMTWYTAAWTGLALLTTKFSIIKHLCL